MPVIEWAFWLCLAWVLYTYAGHPAVLYVLSRFRPSPWTQGDIAPSVTVYVAAYNEAAVIEDKIANLNALNYPGRLDIVVADDGSTDGTAQIAKSVLGSNGRVESSSENLGKTAMQNRIVPELDTELVIFSDATSTWPQDLVTRMVRHFNDDDVGCVAADVRFVKPGNANEIHEQGAYWRYERLLRVMGARYWTNVVVSGTCYAIRRSLFKPLPAEIAEDLGTPAGIAFQGYRVVFDPDVAAVETSAQSDAQEARMRRRISLQNITAIRRILPAALAAPGFATYQFLAHKLMRSYCWAAMLGLLISNIALLSVGWTYSLLLAGQAAVYGAAVLGSFLRIEGPAAALLQLPKYFVLLNMTYGLAQLDYWRGKRGARWQTER